MKKHSFKQSNYPIIKYLLYVENRSKLYNLSQILLMFLSVTALKIISFSEKNDSVRVIL